jgi:hypothetical protein
MGRGGRAGTVRDRNGDYEEIFKHSARVEHVTVRDLRFDQNTDNNTTAVIKSGPEAGGRRQIVLAFWAFDDVEVTRCTFDPCNGVNTVLFAGTNIAHGRITDNTFVFRRHFPEVPPKVTYDSALIYSECPDSLISGNTLTSEILPNGMGGICAIEAHGGPMVVDHNTISGFQISMNIAKREHARPGEVGAVVLSDNTITHAQRGILTWASPDSTLRNLIITNNRIDIAQSEHQDGAWCGGILLFHLSVLTGDTENVIISRNTITFERDTKGKPVDDPNRFAAIGVGPVGSATNIAVTDNTITDAPGRAIIIGNMANKASVYRNITVTGNTITNPGHDLALPATARIAIVARGNLRDVTIADNTITDTVGNLTRAFGIMGTTHTNVVLRHNTVVDQTGKVGKDQIDRSVKVEP